ncbi:MAG TPA: hypothetical protein DF480_05505 [Clostridiales bacterium]|nr:hypothetical protein [Clostridiales bacterium]
MNELNEYANWGWTDRYLEVAAAFPELIPGRVTLQHRSLYRVFTGLGDLTAQVSGKLRHLSAAPSDFPAVGDFVMVDVVVSSSISGQGCEEILQWIGPGKTVAFIGSSGVESADLSTTFADIEELALECRFNDCRHEEEPGCRVRQAISEGLLSEERLQNYKKLQQEAVYQSLNSRQIENEKISRMFAEFGGIKNARDFVKGKNRS